MLEIKNKTANKNVEGWNLKLRIVSNFRLKVEAKDLRDRQSERKENKIKDQSRRSKSIEQALKQATTEKMEGTKLSEKEYKSIFPELKYTSFQI